MTGTLSNNTMVIICQYNDTSALNVVPYIQPQKIMK